MRGQDFVDAIVEMRGNFDKIPFIPLIMSIKSAEVLKNAICLIIGVNHDEIMF